MQIGAVSADPQFSANWSIVGRGFGLQIFGFLGLAPSRDRRLRDAVSSVRRRLQIAPITVAALLWLARICGERLEPRRNPPRDRGWAPDEWLAGPVHHSRN